jgi:hypothetical protein
MVLLRSSTETLHPCRCRSACRGNVAALGGGGGAAVRVEQLTIRSTWRASDGREPKLSVHGVSRTASTSIRSSSTHRAAGMETRASIRL